MINSLNRTKQARFIKSIVQDDPIMDDGIPQVAFIGRSNVGKSSLINALTKSELSRVSAVPGKTREINFFLVNDSVYFVDLPGYGFAKVSNTTRNKLSSLIESYLFNQVYIQKKIVLVIDANVGMTDKDIAMFTRLKESNKDVVVALSKIDKITQKDFHRKIKEIEVITGTHPLFQFSSHKKVDIQELLDELVK